MKLKIHTRNCVDFGKDFQIICYKNGSKSLQSNLQLEYSIRSTKFAIFSWTNSKWQRKILQLVTVSSNTCHNYCLRHIHCNSISFHSIFNTINILVKIVSDRIFHQNPIFIFSNQFISCHHQKNIYSTTVWFGFAIIDYFHP